MARPRTTFVWTLIGGLVLATPALAQYRTIYSDQPAPVPPADVPNAPPVTGPGRQPGYYQPEYQRNYRYQPDYQRTYRSYPPNQPMPPADIPAASVQRGADEPPAEPLPAPMSLPPQRRPGGGTIQTQPLAPLPGAAPTNQARTPPQRSAPPPGQPRQPAEAQPQKPGQIQRGAVQPSEAPAAAPAAPPTSEVVIAPPPERIANPVAVFEGLDKITGRTTTFDVKINETVQFGALQVTPKVCYSRPPTETPQTDSFVDVDEVTLKGKIRRIFTGWMFAASPGLNAVEHPIYDVWLTDCKGGKNPDVADISADQDTKPAKEEHKKTDTKPAPKEAAKPAHHPEHRPAHRAQTRAPRNSPGFLPALR